MGKSNASFYTFVNSIYNRLDGKNNLDKVPAMVYGINLFLCAFMFAILEKIAIQNDGKDSVIGKALENKWKEYFSLVLYGIGVSVAFVHTGISMFCYVVVAAIWLIPDRRIEKKLNK